MEDVRNFAQSIREYIMATGRDLHIDVPLTNLSVGYRTQGNIADMVLPPVTVNKQHNGYYIWPRESWFQVYNADRAPGTRANIIDFEVSSDNYFCKNYALAKEIPLEDLANADTSLRFLQSNANHIMDALNQAWEDRLATLILNTSNVGSNNSLSSDYSDVVNTNPVNDIDDGMQSIRSVTGYEPNVAVFGPLSWVRFRKHPVVINYIRGTGDTVGGGGVTEQQVANAFGLQRVLVGRGIKNTAAEGVTGTYTDIWSNHIALLHVANNPGLMVPTWGYTYQWRPEGFPAPFVVIRDRRDQAGTEHVDALEIMHFQDEKVVGTELGFLIIGA